MSVSKVKTALLSDHAQRMLNLYRSNQRSIGIFDPRSAKMRTEYRCVTAQDFISHLAGTDGIGLVPICDDDKCHWAAIDIDNHGQEEDLPIAQADAVVTEHKLPLLLCRSKSGGIHAYLFLTEPQAASKIRALLARWAALLGYPNAEIFPKQAKLASASDGKKQLGNWINLPYLGAEATQRYGFRAKKKLSPSEFLNWAEKLRVTPEELIATATAEHVNAPPCVQRMITEGVVAGHRNEAMYQCVIYLKKAFPGEIEGRAAEFNGAAFAKPLARSEFQRTVTSASRPDYKYRCGEEPARSWCNKEECLKRKFGISKEEYNTLSVTAELPMFGNLVKFMSDPVRWELEIDGHRVTNLGTPQLLDWKCMRELIAERLMRIVPLIKMEEWSRMLAPLMKEARVVEAPDDASINGAIRARLREFSRKTDLINKGENHDDRKALLRGMPCVQVLDGERQIVFRQQDFVNYLKRTKAEELKGVSLWFAVRDIGVQHTKMRIPGGANINVWYLPAKEVVLEGTTEPPSFETKL